MEFVDTHTHIYGEQFEEDIEDVIARAKEKGVTRLYMPNIDTGSIDAMLSLEARFPDVCIPMMGLHPTSVKGDYEKELSVVEEYLKKRSFVAMGEIGIDLYWDKTFFEQQKKAFVRQINWAKDLDIPIVIHSRDSIPQIIKILKEEKDAKLRGVFHCFTGNAKEAEEIVGLGFKLGIGGVLTFKNSKLYKSLVNVPLEEIVLETDAPYLAPHPFRGERNESSYIPIIAKKLAAIKEVSVEEVAKVTTVNSLKVFKNRQIHTGN